MNLTIPSNISCHVELPSVQGRLVNVSCFNLAGCLPKECSITWANEISQVWKHSICSTADWERAGVSGAEHECLQRKF